ncbi:MAG: hypothetical protein H9993_03970 [Candidatus Desulfovibrio faecigallinarum]|nr:hypothetical protein [Candidatus Desulfovibrio faecigallinarum]
MIMTFMKNSAQNPLRAGKGGRRLLDLPIFDGSVFESQRKVPLSAAFSAPGNNCPQGQGDNTQDKRTSEASKKSHSPEGQGTWWKKLSFRKHMPGKEKTAFFNLFCFLSADTEGYPATLSALSPGSSFSQAFQSFS